ncbi:MAG: cysteine-rich CWC family protein [Betaproteobacteria bacterium]
MPKPELRCPLCGTPNACAPARSGTFDTPCWCTTVTIDAAVIASLPTDQRNQACLCRRCATGNLDDSVGQAESHDTGCGKEIA